MLYLLFIQNRLVFQMRKYSIVHSVRVCTEFVPETFGRLTTLGPKFLVSNAQTGQRRAFQVCQCRCGNYVIVSVPGMAKGDTRSCGCYSKETRTTHGKTGTPEYLTWKDMRRRFCNAGDKQYYMYGGRGIKVCDRWKKFENFFADMGLRPTPQHTLDRFPDKDGNYEPSNCRWANKQEQANNRRTNRMVTIGAKTDTFANWIRHYRIEPSLARARLNRGWEPLAALTEATQTQYRNKNHAPQN